MVLSRPRLSSILPDRPLDAARGALSRKRDSTSAVVDHGVHYGPTATLRAIMMDSEEVKAPRTLRAVGCAWLPNGSSTFSLAAALTIILLLLPTLALFLAGAVVTTVPLGLQLAMVALLLAPCVLPGVLLYDSVLRHRSTRLALVAQWSAYDKLLWTVLLVLTSTLGFATAGTLLVHQQLLEVSGADPEQAGLAYTLFWTYLFHLAEAIPFLDIPGTVDWNPALDFSRWYGDLSVLLYKLMVVVPLIQLLGLTIKQFFDQSRAAGPSGGTSAPAAPTAGR